MPRMLFTAVLLGLVFSRPASAQENVPPTRSARLTDAPLEERKCIIRFQRNDAWPHRALALLRLDRYGCDDSTHRVKDGLLDPDWRVRCFAISLCAGRDEIGTGYRFRDEQNPRVLREALRSGFPVDLDRIARGMETLSQSPDRADHLLAAELGVASGRPDLHARATDITSRLILRMSRVEGGVFSPRLSRLTGTADLGAGFRWKQWHFRAGRGFTLAPSVPRESRDPDPIATLPSEAFLHLSEYVDDLARRNVELAILIDCTASMSGELDAARAGVEDLMLFMENVVAGFRVGLVAYRDRGAPGFEVTLLPFTPVVNTMRAALWSLSAEGGGDTPEAVYPAMKRAGDLAWQPSWHKIMILIGDAPPHVGWGNRCVELAAAGYRNGLVTHAIECEGRPVKHFADIAEAGRGRCVSLANDAQLIPEIAGLTIGGGYIEELTAFFQRYLHLCR